MKISSQKEGEVSLPDARGHEMEEGGEEAGQDKELGRLPQIPQHSHNFEAACLSGRCWLTENPPELFLGCCQPKGSHP